MKLSHKDILDYLQTVFPLEIQEKWDNSGFLVGDINEKTNGILLSLDITEDIINEAIEKNCNLIISHHPLIFKDLKNIISNHPLGKIILKSIKNNISIGCLHTNIDNSKDGINYFLAKKLNLKNVIALKPINNSNKLIGSGVIGNIDELKRNDIINYIKTKLNLENLKYTKITKQHINKIAICSGSGSFLINDAINKGADIFITSDLKYHDYFYATNKFSLIDIGHYESEIYTKSLLLQIISSNFKDVRVLECQTSTNPVYYH